LDREHRGPIQHADGRFVGLEQAVHALAQLGVPGTLAIE
jgi:hypothetical protein